MTGLLAGIARHGTILLPLGIVAGLSLPQFASLLRPLLPLSVFLMLVIIFTRLDIAAAMARMRHPRKLAAAVSVAFIAMPLVFGALIALLRPSPGIALALAIYASSPPNFASAALAYVMRLDGVLCISLILCATLLHPFITPISIKWFVDEAVVPSGFEIAWRLGVMIGGSAMFAWCLRHYLGEERRAARALPLDGCNIVLMLIFVIGLMDGIPAQILQDPGLAAKLAILAFALHLVPNAMVAALFLRSGRRDALTIGYTSGGRNIAIVMAVLASSAPRETWLFFAMLQFPIYVLPIALKPVYNRLAQAEGG